MPDFRARPVGMDTCRRVRGHFWIRPSLGPSRDGWHSVTRELKLALIVGFVVVILVTVLISDHLSQANTTKLAATDVQAPALIQPAETRPDPVFAGRVPPSPGPLMETPASTPEPTIARVEPGDQNAPRVMRLTQGEGSSIEDVVRDLGGTIRDGVIGLPLADTHKMGMGGVEPEAVGRKQNGSGEGSGIDPLPTPQPSKPEVVILPEPKPVVMPEPKIVPEALVFHTVAEGDSLYKIAKQYLGNGNEFRKIIAANPGLTEESPIRPGQKLRIPAKAAESGVKSASTPGATPRAKEAVAKTAPTALVKAASPDRYTVKAGDTISGIAKAVLGSVRYTDAILDANPSVDAETMAVGTVLKIPSVK